MYMSNRIKGVYYMNWVEIIMVGLGTGVGSTMGSYFSNRVLINHLEKIEKRLKKLKSHSF